MCAHVWAAGLLASPGHAMNPSAQSITALQGPPAPLGGRLVLQHCLLSLLLPTLCACATHSHLQN